MRKATHRITLTMIRGLRGIGLDMTITTRRSDSISPTTILGTGDIAGGTIMTRFGVGHTIPACTRVGGTRTGIHTGIHSILTMATQAGEVEVPPGRLAQRVVAAMYEEAEERWAAIKGARQDCASYRLDIDQHRVRVTTLHRQARQESQREGETKVVFRRGQGGVQRFGEEFLAVVRIEEDNKPVNRECIHLHHAKAQASMVDGHILRRHHRLQRRAHRQVVAADDLGDPVDQAEERAAAELGSTS